MTLSAYSGGGAATTLGSIGPVGGGAYDTWYRVVLTCNNAQISGALQRLNDGYWLSAGGLFVPSQTTALTATDSSISGQGYAGVWLIPDTANLSFTDDFLLETVDATDRACQPTIVRAAYVSRD